MAVKINKAAFLAGVAEAGKLPRLSLPEIAVTGRSNVGKSSFINRLAGNKKLARSSSTPGRTRQFNLFEFEISSEKLRNKKMILADLPGFGYAKFSKEERQKLASMTVQYLSKRDRLTAICLLTDCRRVPERDEVALQQLAFDHGIHLLVVVTKADKLKRNELNRSLKTIASAYGLEDSDLIVQGEGISPAVFWERALPLIE